MGENVPLQTSLLIRDMGGMERAEVVLRLLNASNTHFPPPGIPSFMAQED